MTTNPVIALILIELIALLVIIGQQPLPVEPTLAWSRSKRSATR